MGDRHEFHSAADIFSKRRLSSSLIGPLHFLVLLIAFIALLFFSKSFSKSFDGSSRSGDFPRDDAPSSAGDKGSLEFGVAAATSSAAGEEGSLEFGGVVATIVVDRQGRRGSNFTTVAAAVEAVARMRKDGLLDGRVVIFLRKGIYKEKIVIPREVHNVTLQGSSAYEVTLTYDDMAARPAPEGEPSSKQGGILGTLHSASVTVQAPGFIARDITFENSYKFIPWKDGQQAVAYCIEGDMAAHYNCRFLGWQDTIYDRRGRHCFYNCYIEGAMDFIFGEEGQSIYENCTILAKRSGYAPSIAAHKRLCAASDIPFGFVFLRSSVRAQRDTKVALGRAWGDCSRVVFALCHLADVVDSGNPWDDWGIPSRRSTVFFAEFGNTGPGAAAAPRNPWTLLLTKDEAQPFLSHAFIDGAHWLSPAPPPS